MKSENDWLIITRDKLRNEVSRRELRCKTIEEAYKEGEDEFERMRGEGAVDWTITNHDIPVT